jgi:hypothetical protein
MPHTTTKTAPDGTYIKRVQLIGTEILIYSAWVPGRPVDRRIGTDPDPAEYDDLPARSDVRWAAYHTARAERCRLAYKLICRAFPEIDPMEARFQDGEIVTTTAQLRRLVA